MRPQKATCMLILSALPLVANAFQFETTDRLGNRIRTCDKTPCATMPNPLDVFGLQLRQATRGGRKLIMFSKDSTITCAIRDGATLVSTRVNKSTLPTIVELRSNQDTRFECYNENGGQPVIFYVPAIEVLAPFEK